VIVELNSETDFVARAAEFQTFLSTLAKTAATLPLTTGGKGVEELEKADLVERVDDRIAKTNVGEALLELSALLGERVALRRMAWLPLPPDPATGVLGSYVHNEVRPTVGSTASLVRLRLDPPLPSPDDQQLLQRLALALAMQVVASRPRYITEQQVPPDVLESERQILKAAMAASGGGPQAEKKGVIDKMVEGKLRKLFEEEVLMHQEFVTYEKARMDAHPKATAAPGGGKEGAAAKLPTVGPALKAIGSLLGSLVEVDGVTLLGLGLPELAATL